MYKVIQAWAIFKMNPWDFSSANQVIFNFHPGNSDFISIQNKSQLCVQCKPHSLGNEGMALLRIRKPEKKKTISDWLQDSLSLHVFVYLWVMNYFQKTVFCSHSVFPSFLICTFDKTWGKTSSCIQKRSLWVLIITVCFRFYSL